MRIAAIYRPGAGLSLPLPFFVSAVPAGFPSPAEDYIDTSLDLNDYLIRHPASTYFVRVAGDSMVGASINPGDILVVDRSLTAGDGTIVIASVCGELTVKRLRRRDGALVLVPENSLYPELELTDESDFSIWGVVIYVIHRAE